jgi:hypothetical protein
MAHPRSGQPSSLLSVFSNKRELLVRLILAEVIAKPGEGPLAPRFSGALQRGGKRAQEAETPGTVEAGDSAREQNNDEIP